MYGKKLKDLREEPINFVRQKELAEMLNVHVSDYSQYEGEAIIIPLKHLISICNYFNVSLDYIFDFTNIRNYSNSKENVDINIFIERIRELRKENNLTQAKLAKLLNVTQSLISNYEKGKYLVSTSFLYYICKKYNISADYLLGRVNSPKNI
jgi:transcriptional regulator with XRE-family HTH domain